MLISGTTPVAQMDQSIAPAHQRTSAYPMQPSSRVGVHSRTRGHHTGKAEITRFPAHNPEEDSDQSNKLKSGSSRLMF